MTSNTLKIKIVTPDGVLCSEVAHKVNLQTESGEITILPDHIPLVSVLKPGLIRVTTEHKELEFRAQKGVLEVRKGSEVFVLVEEARVEKNS